MILMFLSALLMVYSAQLFSISFSLQGVNRALVNTPIELMHSAVLFSDDGIHFNKNKFENVVLRYYENVITRYTKQYDVTFYYYNLLDGSMCIEDDCSGVEITVDCKLTFVSNYSRTMYYEIRGNN